MAMKFTPNRQKNPLDSQPLPDLPLEVIAEILSKLPVKPLLQFRCVSKSWHSLISDPKFVKAHLKLASVSTDYTHHRLLLSSIMDRKLNLKSCSVSSILHDQSDTTAVTLQNPFDDPRYRVTIRFIGSCNGLLSIMRFMRYESTLHIWNPATGKSKKLPDVKKADKEIIATCGFGYDDSIDDYKVVVILGDCDGRVIDKGVLEVYTLRTDSWRRIGDSPPVARSCVGVFVSGALHWTSLDCIVSLDLAKETFGEVLLPDYDRDRCSEFTLGVLSGWLCAVPHIDDFVEVWVMKDYGIGESWTKLITIPFLTPMDGDKCVPLCLLKNNGVVMHNRMNIVRYCPKDAKFSYPTIQNCVAPPFRVCSYFESLVSPDSDERILRQQHI